MYCTVVDIFQASQWDQWLHTSSVGWLFLQHRTVYKQLTQLACTRSCIISSNCMFLMYNPHNNTCFHLQGSQPCHLATPSPEIMIMRFRPSLQEQCLVPSQHPNNRLLVHPLAIHACFLESTKMASYALERRTTLGIVHSMLLGLKSQPFVPTPTRK